MEWKDYLKTVCPHCLSNEDLSVTVTASQNSKEYWISCSFCGTFTRFDKKDSLEQMTEKWQTRSSTKDDWKKDIKTCPFCDTNECLSIKTNEIISGSHKGSTTFNMVCSYCGVDTQFCDVKSIRGLMIFWNTREMEY